MRQEADGKYKVSKRSRNFRREGTEQGVVENPVERHSNLGRTFRRTMEGGSDDISIPRREGIKRCLKRWHGPCKSLS
ncbi:hypothetical protein CEXT_727711 [Caerostris extrusa]|uniref:Uncharacterized protein n=1 Tax=Caerostris extrusa TaxID=172846 RepID=A0AAV4R9V6_CAEEX|nr:hypothetical protein CEXT_727711 [Caerostris extrusa]